MKLAPLIGAVLIVCGCGNYREFTLSPVTGTVAVTWQWHADPGPQLSPGHAWDSVDVLNPSVLLRDGVFWNLYSGFDGKSWKTGLATSPDGRAWTKRGEILSPPDAGYIAANGTAIQDGSELLYFYQTGWVAQIALARSANGRDWRNEPEPVLRVGPYGSWDERGVADPYVIREGSHLYLYYTGMDRARRQRLGVATSEDGGRTWYKLRSNPILEIGAFGSFDENGLGEPAVWASDGRYWMLYTGRDRQENRRLGLAESVDGVHWRRTPLVISGDQPWDSKVICDPSVIAEPGRVRVWFGGGDVPRPDENIHGQIGYGELTPKS